MATPQRRSFPDVAEEARAQDGRAIDRWINEGGLVAPGRAARRASVPPAVRRATRPRVLIVGGGVAGLETLLALRALAADRVDVTLLAPELKFVNRSLAAGRPFEAPWVRGLRLADIADEFGARFLRGALDRVEHGQRRVVTKDGDRLGYDVLVLAVGARPVRTWQSDGVLTFHGGDDDGLDCYPVVLHQLRRGQIKKLAFVKPVGVSYLLALYELALMTAADCRARRRDVELSLVTPEPEPLAVFGASVSAAIGRLLDECGVTPHTSSDGIPRGHRWLDISPGDRGVPVDRIVTLPRLVGPRLRGIPCGPDGFIRTDAHGRLAGIAGVFAAGDATDVAIKQGGLAAQQADAVAVAEMIAFSAGVDIDPQPFRPMLRAVLLTGGKPRYLRADISAGAAQDSIISAEPLWCPPTKLCGSYLAAYLSCQVGERRDVITQDEDAIAVETALDPAAQQRYGELADRCALSTSRS